MQMDDMVDCKKGFIASERIETEHAWRIDFKDMFESAVSEATPHWEAANEAASRAQELERVIKKLKVQIRANDCNSIKKKKLQSELENFNESSAKEREIQAKEQAAGDAIYWSIYNLDHKNPNSSNALEHRPPQELVESILAKENEILSLMKKIKAEVSSLS
jgi:type I restriction enzyme M protein